jgi:tetratricopeptide (TPR) repeat protein
VGSEVIYRDASGKVLRMADLKNVAGAVRWEIPGAAPVPSVAIAEHDRGRALGGQGQYDESIEALRHAHALAPSWPYPLYDLAYTYLLMDRQDEALAMYEQVDRLAPRGFFTCKTALWTLHREAAGAFPRGTYRYYLSMEWTADEAQQLRIARALVDRLPGFAPGWKELSKLLKPPEDRLRAADTGLGASPDPETFTILVINKAAALQALGRRDDAIKLLGGLILNPPADATVATTPLLKAALASMQGPK